MRRNAGKLRVLCLLLCLCFAIGGLAAPKAAADGQIDKVLATTSYTPVALMPVSYITVATSTEGCYVESVTWFDSNNQVETDSFDTNVYHLEICLCTLNGYSFSDGLAAYLNNSAVSATVLDASTLVLRRDYTPMVWQPTVVKHPGAETVTEGGWASFVATATYATGYSWGFKDTVGRSVSCADISSVYPGVSVEGDGTEKIIVYGIPRGMDGWRVVCTFSGPGGSVASNGALLTVNADPAKATPAPSPGSSAKPAASPMPSPDAHEHAFQDKWSSDAQYHWHECDCGEKRDKAEHSFTWTETRAATRDRSGEEEGVCSVCGYKSSRALPYSDSADSGIDLGGFRIVFFGILAIILLGAAVLVVQAVHERRRRRR